MIFIKEGGDVITIYAREMRDNATTYQLESVTLNNINSIEILNEEDKKKPNGFIVIRVGEIKYYLTMPKNTRESFVKSILRDEKISNITNEETV